MNTDSVGTTTVYGVSARTAWRGTEHFSYQVGFTYGRVGVVIEGQRQNSTDLLTVLYTESFAIHYLEALRIARP
jgi:hypothetical protein